MYRQANSGRWYMVAILTAAMAIAYFDRVIVSLLVDPIKHSLSITDFQISLLQGLAFVLLYATAGMPLARLADRRSRRAVIIFGIAAWSLATALCGLAQTYVMFLVGRIVVGLGEAGLAPAASSLIASAFSRRELAVPVSIFAGGAYVGAALAFFLTGSLYNLFVSIVPVSIGVVVIDEGWRLFFLAAAAIGLVVAALAWTIAEPAREKPTFVAERGGGLFPHLLCGWRHYLPHFLGFSMLMMVNQIIYAWLPVSLMRTFHVTPSYVGVRLALIMSICGIGGSLLGGTLADAMARRGRHDAAMIIGLVAACGLLAFGVVAPLLPTAATVLLCTVPVVFLMCLPFGAAFGSLPLVAPPALRARVAAVYLFCTSVIGAAVGPAATAAITDFVFGDTTQVRYSIAIMVGMCSVSAMLFFVTGRRAFAQAVMRHKE